MLSTPSRSSSVYARAIVFGLTTSSFESCRTEGSRSPGCEPAPGDGLADLLDELPIDRRAAVESHWKLHDEPRNCTKCTSTVVVRQDAKFLPSGSLEPTLEQRLASLRRHSAATTASRRRTQISAGPGALPNGPCRPAMCLRHRCMELTTLSTSPPDRMRHSSPRPSSFSIVFILNRRLGRIRVFTSIHSRQCHHRCRSPLEHPSARYYFYLIGFYSK